MGGKENLQGHFLAFFTILVWGTTFISAKIVLNTLDPLQVSFYRFLIAYIALFLIRPQFKLPTDMKEELLFLLAGLTGVTLYMLMENLALTFSTASNVGLIISIAPIFTAGLFHLLVKEEEVTLTFFLGFMIAMTGIFLVMFNGQHVLKLNPLGDLLAVMAAVFWALYSVILKKILKKEYHVIDITRKIFFYSLLTMAPFMILSGFTFDFAKLKDANVIFNLLFLSIGASAVGYITWARASKILGSVKTSAYIYLSPFVTIVVSVIVLHEKITSMIIAGSALILTGLYLSNKKRLL